MRKRELVFLPSFTINLLFLIEGVSLSSGCLGKAALFYCDTPWAFNITYLIIIINVSGMPLKKFCLMPSKPVTLKHQGLVKIGLNKRTSFHKGVFLGPEYFNNILGTNNHIKGTCIVANFESNGPLLWCLLYIKSGWGNSLPVLPEVINSDFLSSYNRLAKSFGI